MQRRLHAVVDLQNYDTMESRGTVPYTIVSIYKSCPDSFSHALMSAGVAVSLQNLRKRDSDFWVYHKRKSLFVYTVSPHPFVQLASPFQKCSV